MELELDMNKYKNENEDDSFDEKLNKKYFRMFLRTIHTSHDKESNRFKIENRLIVREPDNSFKLKEIHHLAEMSEEAEKGDKVPKFQVKHHPLDFAGSIDVENTEISS
jgi:hypothetical protein